MKKEFDILVYVGRFQPFHAGHLHVLREAEARADRVLVFVGSAFEPVTVKNPWSYYIRADIIRTLAGPHTLISALPDAIDNTTWARNVTADVNEFAKQYIREISDGFISLGLADLKIGIIGCDKDHTSFYLHMFPKWEKVLLEPGIILDATTLREKIFENTWDMEAYESIPYSYSALEIESSKLAVLRDEYFYYKGYKRDNPPVSPQGYMQPKYCADLAIQDPDGRFLLIERGKVPGVGKLAMPGGFVDPGESSVMAAVREVEEEVGMIVNETDLRLVHLADNPSRSLRGFIISAVYLYRVHDFNTVVKSTPEAPRHSWLRADEMNSTMFFDDHYHLLQEIHRKNPI